MEVIDEEAAALVEGGEGDEVELAIRHEEEVLSLAEVRQQGTEDEAVEGLGCGQVGDGFASERVMQEQGGAVNGFGLTEVNGTDMSIGEEQEGEITRGALTLSERRAGLGNKGAVLVGDELDENAVGGQGCRHLGDDLSGRREEVESAQRLRAPREGFFQRIALLCEILEALLVVCRREVAWTCQRE
jgi:hypothetical protein